MDIRMNDKQRNCCNFCYRDLCI